jgi:hypothetical protein
MDVIQIKRRKIQARQFIQADEGPVKWKTKKGYQKARDKDYLIELEPGIFTFIPEAAMEYLQAKDNES